MNLDLAEMYGTPGAEEAIEEREKVAQYELFAKLAADNEINLSELSDEQVGELWDATFGKEAEEKCEKCGKAECECPAAKSEAKDEGGEKTSSVDATAAEAEFLQEKEWTEKLAEADFLGRTMAHAYVNELGDIGESMDLEKEALSKTEIGMRGRDAVRRLVGDERLARLGESAAKGSEKAKGWGESLRSAATGKKFREGQKRIGGAKMEAERRMGKADASSRFGKKTTRATGKYQNLVEAEGRKQRRRGAMETGGLYGGATLAAGGTAAAMNKKGSASLDELAFDLAIEKAAESGWDASEAADRINSVFTLGLFDEENTKIAAAEDVEGAIEIRSLEMLESAGYDVEWD